MEEQNDEDFDLIRKMSAVHEKNLCSDGTLEILLESVIQTLSNCINGEFNRSAGSKNEELFCAPSLIGFDLTSKMQLARDLADLLYNCKSQRESILTSQSIESLRNYRPSSSNFTNKDLLNSIMKPDNEGLYVNPVQAEEILTILQNNSATSETNRYRMPLASYQREFITVFQKIDEMQKTLRKKQDEHDFLDISNRKLRETINLLKKQEQNLEKQVEDSVVECYLYKEHKDNLSKQLDDSMESLYKIQACLRDRQTASENQVTFSSPQTEKETQSLNPFRMSKMTDSSLP